MKIINKNKEDNNNDNLNSALFKILNDLRIDISELENSLELNLGKDKQNKIEDKIKTKNRKMPKS